MMQNKIIVGDLRLNSIRVSNFSSNLEKICPDIWPESANFAKLLVSTYYLLKISKATFANCYITLKRISIRGKRYFVADNCIEKDDFLRIVDFKKVNIEEFLITEGKLLRAKNGDDFWSADAVADDIKNHPHIVFVESDIFGSLNYMKLHSEKLTEACVKLP